MSPADDERDNLLNVAPHVEWVTNGLYQFLPGLSRGTGEPQPTARLECTRSICCPATAKAFEAALSAGQSKLRGEVLWYRMVAGGTTPRYVRLRPQAGLAAVLDGAQDQGLPEGVTRLIGRLRVEIWTLRPTMSLGLESPARP